MRDHTREAQENDERIFRQIHGTDEREDWERSWRYRDECYRTRKPAAQLEAEDEAEAA